MFYNIYEEALKAEQYIRLQVFKMILNGVPRSGKTTFWKRLAIKDFHPSDISPSTGGAEFHFISALESKESAHLNEESSHKSEESAHNSEESAHKSEESSHKSEEFSHKSEESTHKSEESTHMRTEILFDLHLYSETDSSDLDNEAFFINKHTLLEHDKAQVGTQSKALMAVEGPTTSKKTLSEAEIATPPIHLSLANESLPVPLSSNTPTDVSYPQPAEHMGNKIDPVSEDIHHCCNKMLNMLKSGENIPLITIIKRLCHLVDVGGQRAFLEMLPTVSFGKALYLIFFFI